MFHVIWHNLNQFTRTRGNTFSTSFTSFFINHSNAINNVDCIKWTGFHTRSFSKTSICTSLWPAILHHIDHDTVTNSIIFVICCCLLTCSTTFYKCYFMDLLACRHSHNLTNLGCDWCTSDRTASNFRFSLCNCCRKAGASGISTTATVISRKHSKNCLFSLIYFNRKFLSGKSKEYTNEQASTTYDNGSNNNSCNIHCLSLLYQS